MDLGLCLGTEPCGRGKQRAVSRGFGLSPYREKNKTAGEKGGKQLFSPAVLFFSLHGSNVENFNLFKKDFLLIYSQIGHIMYIDSETDKGQVSLSARRFCGILDGTGGQPPGN